MRELRAWQVGLLVLLAVAVGCTTRSCCREEPAPSTMILEDVHTAKWITVTDEWIEQTDLGSAGHDVCTDPAGEPFGACAGNYESPASTPDDYRPGLMMQIGGLWNQSGTATNEHFGLLRITYREGNVETFVDLDEGEFDWLDVRAAGTPCPIDAWNAYQLFQQSPSNLFDTLCEACLETSVKSDLACSALQPDPCLRKRSLDASLRPNIGLITYWPGDDLYEIEIERKVDELPDSRGSGAPGGERLTRTTFRMHDAVEIDQWLHGCLLRRYPNVTEVWIDYAPPGQNHDPFHEPPVDGGR